MKVDESLIKKVREENDIVDVISEYLPLEQKGKKLFLCMSISWWSYSIYEY